MIRDLALAAASVTGAGALGAAVMLITAYLRAGPEFPPPEPVQQDT